MLKRSIYLLIVLSILLLSANALSATVCVTDRGDLLETEEEVFLETKANQIESEYGIDVLILTLESLNGQNTWDAADDFYYSGGYSGNGILLLISMEYRDWEIATYGLVADRISDSKTMQLFNEMADDLANNDFYSGFDTYLDALDRTLARYYADRSDSSFEFDYTSEEYSENHAYQLLASLGIGALVAAIVLAVMRGKMNSARAQHGAAQYMQQGSYRLTTQRDVYLYSNTTRVRRSDNNSSGGSRGGGGGSRGGSRGKF